MKIKRILVLCACTLLASVAFAQEVTTDYDHTVDFLKYRTFMWIKEPTPDNPLMKQRIIDAVNAQLRARGLKLVTNDADLGVSANTATTEQQTLQSFYDGFVGWGWDRYWGPVTTVVDTYQVGTLVVDLFDTRTKQVNWWASATDTISHKSEKNVKRLNRAVEKMFKDFPPKRKPETE
jgi:hypothetical protein